MTCFNGLVSSSFLYLKKEDILNAFVLHKYPLGIRIYFNFIKLNVAALVIVSVCVCGGGGGEGGWRGRSHAYLLCTE